MYPTRTTSTTGSFHVPPVPEPEPEPAPAASAATTSGWAAQMGWAAARTPEPELEPEHEPLPVAAAAPAPAPSPVRAEEPYAPAPRTRTEAGPQPARLPHPQSEAGPHLPHPQPEAAPEFARAQAEADAGRSHPQDEAWPVPSPVRGEPLAAAGSVPEGEAARRSGTLIGAPAPEADPVGREPSHCGAAPAAAGRAGGEGGGMPARGEYGHTALAEADRQGGAVGHGAPVAADPVAAPAVREPSRSVPAPAGAEAVPAGAVMDRVAPSGEAGRSHPQDDVWPVHSPVRGEPSAAADSLAEGEAARQGSPLIGAPAAEAEPAARELSWSVPAPAGEAAAHAEPRTPAPGDAGGSDAYDDIYDDIYDDTYIYIYGEAGDPAEPEPAHTTPAEQSGEASAAEAEAEVPDPSGSVPVPGPGVVEVVARAVARMEDDTQDLPPVAAVRGVAVSEVPVHLPFRGAARPPARSEARADSHSHPHSHAPAEEKPKPPARPAPGRRVPRGDDRLREHRGPVLPGWIGVAVGGLALAGCAVVLWRAGAVPDALAVAFGAEPRPYRGLQARFWPPLAFLGIVALLALGGLGRGRAGHAWVLTLFGRYRGTVRRSGLTWISPLLLRRRVDVRLRHWRSDPMSAVDSGGLALQVVVQVVWQVKDPARATLAVADHVEYLTEQVESAMARVLSQLPADAFHEDAPTLRDAEAVGDALTRMLAAETEAVGVEVFSAQPTRIEYAPEVAQAMRRRRVAAIDAKHRDTILTSVVDAVDDTVHQLTSRGIVDLDDYERKALVKDLTVAFYTGRPE